ncbi:MAG: tetratricopeptide repeat protein [Bacteroidales bacterium]|nr:tetratricopeptide repeat protein [Bacteroidales bacterium]
MKTYKEIEEKLFDGDIEESFNDLTEFLGNEPNNARAWYTLGIIYRRKQMWGDAINAFNKAKMIEPEGPADAAIESIYDIIRFVNKDLMNP